MKLRRYITPLFAALLLCLAGTTSAFAATSDIQTFSTSYKAYNPSSYWMSWMTPAQHCSQTQTIYGAKPATADTYPTVVYIHGTTADWASNNEGQRFIQLAAQQGFNALAITYDSSGLMNPVSLNGHAYCMFDQAHTANGMTALCTAAAIDCTKGVGVIGFSQGAGIAVLAKNYNQTAKAAWLIGLTSSLYPDGKIPKDATAAPAGTRAFTNDKIVLNMGEASNMFTHKPSSSDLPSQKTLTGKDCGTGYDCLAANGSGYYVVSNGEVADGYADHCYWMSINKSDRSCTLAPGQLDPGFQPPTTTKWSMIRNLNWLQTQLQ